MKRSNGLLLKVQNLRTYFYGNKHVIRAVDGVSFSVNKGQTVCIVGESGCGKSMTALSIMRLVPHPGKIVAGSVVFEGEDLVTKNEKEMCSIRGRRISIIFQEPMTALNPVFTVGDQVIETLHVHEHLPAGEAERRAVELLGLVGIPSPSERMSHYPHQLSGGLRQRIMIAMALACRPSLVIADEPTTALDVTIQAQILDLIAGLQEKLGMAILLITHNLGVVAAVAERVIVMYAGRVVEETEVHALFARPLHPYTKGLFASLPTLSQERLTPIPGVVPSLFDLPDGCAFQNRCPEAREECRHKEIELVEVETGHFVRCINVRQ
ncbi:MAG: ABC transporter ATP-binding protein [Pseudomonadota bacterium]